MKTGALRGVAAIAAIYAPLISSVNLAVTLAMVSPARAADDAFAWAPAARAGGRARPVRAARASASLGLTEIEVEVDDLYDAANRQALALAERTAGGGSWRACRLRAGGAARRHRRRQRQTERAASAGARTK